MHTSRARAAAIRAVCWIIGIGLAAGLAACTPPVGPGTPEPPATYSLSYDANGADSGAAPVDPTEYESNGSATVLDTGTMARTGHFFYRWNTAADASGEYYDPGDSVSLGGASVTLYAIWGSNAAVAISASVGNSYIIDSDGTLWIAGSDAYGQIGNGATYAPAVSFERAMGGVASVQGGQLHTVVLDDAGRVWTTGFNYAGQIGDSTTDDATSFYHLADGAVGVFAGGRGNLTMYELDDGTVWGVGDNSKGQIDDSGNAAITQPVEIAVPSNLDTIVTSGNHTFFLQTNGTLYAMGWNYYGQYGDTTTTSSDSPVQVATGIEAVAAGPYHSLFLKDDGTLWASGYNAQGQLGSGSHSSTATPIQVLSSVDRIYAGEADSFAIKGDGTLWAAGGNGTGQYGDGTTTSQTSFTQVDFDGADGILDIAVGTEHTLFLMNDGTAWASGRDELDQLGNGPGSDTLISPEQVWPPQN